MSDQEHLWVVVDVGCIECCVQTLVVGVFSSEEAASIIAHRRSHHGGWRDGGQCRVEVIKVPRDIDGEFL